MNFIETIIKQKESPKTYLEILKIHDKEVPIANLLAYFFRPKEKHGFDDLFIKALLKTFYDKKLNDNILRSKIDNILNVKVKTEVNAGDDKRIDILIDAKEIVVCIEFKINHVLDNPLAVYQKFVREKFADKKEYIFIILTPYKKEAEGKALEKNDFELLILSKFIQNVKLFVSEKYPNKMSDYIFNDFIQTIENRSLRNQQEENLKRILQEFNLTIETAEFIPREKSEFWSELLVSLKLRTLYENLQKINEVTFIKNSDGGFIQIKYSNFTIKLRINEERWQIEKWFFDNSNKEIINIFDFNTNFNKIIGYLNQIDK